LREWEALTRQATAERGEPTVRFTPDRIGPVPAVAVGGEN
jgi:hypothetical protein